MYTDSRQKKNEPHSASVSRAELRHEQLADRRARDGLFARVDEHGVGRHVVAEPAQQRGQLRPALLVPRQEARRLRQHLQQERRQHQRQQCRRRGTARASRSAAGSAPPMKPASDPPSGMQTIVSVTANGRCRVGHVLGRQRRGVRHRAAEAEARRGTGARMSVDGRRRERHQERQHAERDRRCRAARRGGRADRRRSRRWRRRTSCRPCRSSAPA